MAGRNLLWLKMRPDTPQLYEYITVEQITANVQSFINIHPWTQFFDLGGRTDKPVSIAGNIVMRDCQCTCETCFDIEFNEEQYRLSEFTFENLSITARKKGLSEDMIDKMTIKNVEISV